MTLLNQTITPNDLTLSWLLARSFIRNRGSRNIPPSRIARVGHFDFSGSVFLEKSIPTSAGRVGRIFPTPLTRKEISEIPKFCGRAATGFSVRGVSTRKPRARTMLQSETGWTEGYCEAMSGRNKGSKKVLRLSEVRCRRFSRTTSTSRAITGPAAMNTAVVSHWCVIAP